MVGLWFAMGKRKWGTPARQSNFRCIFYPCRVVLVKRIKLIVNICIFINILCNVKFDLKIQSNLSKSRL